jgi:hypothetical protein
MIFCDRWRSSPRRSGFCYIRAKTAVGDQKLVARSTHAPIPAERGRSPERVLVIFPGALGDLICLLPALRAVGRRYRACSVELMARAELAEFAVGRMGLARGHSIDRREVSALFSPAADAAAAAAEFSVPFPRFIRFSGSTTPARARSCRWPVPVRCSSIHSGPRLEVILRPRTWKLWRRAPQLI